MRRSLSISASAFLASALALTGCTSSGETDPSASPTSPLSEYFSAVYGGDLDEQAQQEKWAAEDREREQLVATCMSEQGFEYRPSESNYSTSSNSVEWEPEDRDWVSEYGYGVVNYPGRDEPILEDDYTDPNADYLESLPESEQEAFYEALYGPPTPEEEIAEDGSYDYNWETAGCYGFAQNEMSVEDATLSEEHQPVMDAINDLYMDMAQRPEFAELDAQWASCMSDAGYPGFTVQFDAQESMYGEQEALWGDGAEGEMPDEAAMAALGEREVELALADLACREETDYRAQYTELQNELEQQFIDDNQAALDAMLADAQQRN